jgi:hypothetical protein
VARHAINGAATWHFLSISRPLILSAEAARDGEGTKKGLGFIAGWLVSLMLVIAVVVLITGGRPVRMRTVPSTAAVIAAVMQPWTLVAAAAVTAAQARLSSAGDYLALAVFCLLATSSFIVLELYAVLAPAAGTQLAALRAWLDGATAHLVRTGMADKGAVGVACTRRSPGAASVSSVVRGKAMEVRHDQYREHGTGGSRRGSAAPTPGRDGADYRRLVRDRAGTGPAIRWRWRGSGAHRPERGQAAGAGRRPRRGVRGQGAGRAR